MNTQIEFAEVEATQLKTTFYPMAGGIADGYANLRHSLSWLAQNQPTPEEFVTWLREEYDLSFYFARNIHTVLLVSSGLTHTIKGHCAPTAIGRAFLAAPSPFLLFEVFAASFVGFAGLLECVAEGTLTSQELSQKWQHLVNERFPQTLGWNESTQSTQFGHRAGWLRALGLLEVEKGMFRLTNAGKTLCASRPPELLAVTSYEVQHQAKELSEVTTQDFRAFEPSKRTLRQQVVRDRAFSRVVCEQYDSNCAICGFRLQSPRGRTASQAAHIIPKSHSGSDDPRNGLCLCYLCHWAFDEGLLAVKPKEKRVAVSTYAIQQQPDWATRNGALLRTTKELKFAPDDEALDWHFNHIWIPE